MSLWEQIGSNIEGTQAHSLQGIVSINNNGDVIAIGAYKYDNTHTNQGVVKVYGYQSGDMVGGMGGSPSGWVQLGGDIYGESTNDQSGYSLNLNGDGTILAIGAHKNDGDDGNYTDSGQVRIYQYDSTKTSSDSNGPAGWNQLGGDIDGFIYSYLGNGQVSLNNSGTIFAVGGIGNNDHTGYVKIYEYNSTKTDPDSNGPAGWDQLGSDILGENMEDSFGKSVSLNSDGTIVVVGANQNDGTDGVNNKGQAKVFQYNSSSNSWSQVGQTIYGDSTNDELGICVDINSTGDVIGIGARFDEADPSSSEYYNNSGSVKVFQLISNTWTQIGAVIYGTEINSWTGSSISLKSNSTIGTIISIGSPLYDGNGNDKGLVKCYKYDSSKTSSDYLGPSGWNQLGNDIQGINDYDESFHNQLNSDGTKLIIGSTKFDNSNGESVGCVRVFELKTFTLSEAESSGYTTTDIVNSGISISDIVTASREGNSSITPFDLKSEADVPLTNLFEADVKVNELVTTNNTITIEDLMNNSEGVSAATILANIDSSTATVEDYSESNITDTQVAGSKVNNVITFDPSVSEVSITSPPANTDGDTPDELISNNTFMFLSIIAKNSSGGDITFEGKDKKDGIYIEIQNPLLNPNQTNYLLVVDPDTLQYDPTKEPFILYYNSETDTYYTTLTHLTDFMVSPTTSPCFYKDTRILCYDKSTKLEYYKKISEINNDIEYIRTFGTKEPYSKIIYFGKTLINNDNYIDPKKRLYQHKIHKDVILSGIHSMLYNKEDISDEIIKKMKEHTKWNDEFLIIDNKYKVLTFLDPNFEIYDKVKESFIYQIGIESENNNLSYGLYLEHDLFAETTSMKAVNKLINWHKRK